MNRLLNQEDPRLRTIAEPVPMDVFNSAWLKELVHSMLEIMKAKGAVGVAAPQIGVNKRIIVFGTAYSRRRRSEVIIPDAILINPVIEHLSAEKESGYEGCLNCADLMGPVARSLEIDYAGYHIDGRPIKKHATGLEARILQHEVDHLDGLLFLDRIEDKASLTTYEKLKQEENPA